MKTPIDLFNNAINQWRDIGGKGTAFIAPPLDPKVMVLLTLQKVYAKNPCNNVIIVVNNFNDRTDIIEFLTHQSDEENNREFKKLIDEKFLRIYTLSYAKTYIPFHACNLCILYKPESFDPTLSSFVKSKFKLVILSKLLPSEDSFKLHLICPLLDAFEANEVEAVRLSTPVEEMRCGVEIPIDSNCYKTLQDYNDYIATSINIFGSFDIMQQARLGNPALNISATQICAQIADENGWKDKMDMRSELNAQIDALYNPNNLRDRASQTYEVIRKRTSLLANYEGKLETILEIIKKHQNEKILIINKFGEFANIITDYVNSMADYAHCGNYHDKVENIPAVDSFGNPVYYKSGEHKGERRMMGAKMQKTTNVKLFNQGKLNVLSANAAPDKDLECNIDVVIITSPMCEELKSYLYRLSKVIFGSPIHLYYIYCESTMEQKILDNRAVPVTHTLLNDVKRINEIENNLDFIVVD